MLRSCIKDRSIDKTALVDNLNLISSLRNFSLTSLDHLVLQSTRQDLHSRFLGILCKEFLACTSQSFLLVLTSFLLTKDSCIIGNSCNKTTAEHGCINRILSALQFLTSSWKDALRNHLSNLHTDDVCCALRSICLIYCFLITTDKICHISSIHLITLLNEWYQTTCSMNTGSITQRVACCS